MLSYFWILILECIAAYNITYSNAKYVQALSLAFNLSVYCYNLYYGLRIYISEKDTNAVAERASYDLKSSKREVTEVDIQTYESSLVYALSGMAIALGSYLASENILTSITYLVSTFTLYGQICAGMWYVLF